MASQTGPEEASLPDLDPAETARRLELEQLRQYDGAERVPLLEFAHLITIAPVAREDDPALVQIAWSPSALEHPFPGSSLWRAALEVLLARAPSDDPADAVLRSQISRSLERYPDLETWWHWVRTGWTAPPKVEAAVAAGKARRPWWSRWRR